MPRKVGVLNCTNTARDISCPAVSCLESVRTGSGPFARYQNQGGAELVGIISCDGCPTLVAPERILGKVHSLVAAGAESIHLSSCMMAACPFKAKYARIIREAYPKVEVVEGTHVHPVVTPEMFAQSLKQMLTQPETSMANALEELAKMAPPAARS